MAIARRRVESSIWAFGGNVSRDGPRSDIFRSKGPDVPQSVTVTPSSSTSSPPSSDKSRTKTKYEEALVGRYYENESRLSWEFEESPPVEVDNEAKNKKSQEDRSSDDVKVKSEDKSSEDDSASQEDSQAGSESRLDDGSNQQPKMRYRCKLCGQPKQNHRCPYRQSLARSIGIMVYPAVNAFTAAEPGSIAAPLSEMNNFTDVMKEGLSMEDSPGRPTPHMTGMPMSNQVTPESIRSSKVHPAYNSHRSGARRQGRGKKRGYGDVSAGENPNDLVFIDSMELKSEQYRVISSGLSSRREGKEAYSYPALPLPYAQRKRLSDNLFSLSNEVPKLTDECAKVLREAREKDMWDVAVAELMTQVVVVIHCPDGDNRFEGLRQYLLTLGIAC